ncbi:hypothetical protein GO730_02350 [Spirosoma sp. HMF3257]|uniref:Uncharacterized protein n=1 Tax=Spirosoma telluris TaxID=2183553 RepID=A0A327NF76_9BACT|nr:hypothetical protein [Spirosoma telluris]RAI73545.1 hypothetical protein HMF3257_02290 [Spirosoma telluris]
MQGVHGVPPFRLLTAGLTGCCLSIDLIKLQRRIVSTGLANLIWEQQFANIGQVGVGQLAKKTSHSQTGLTGEKAICR